MPTPILGDPRVLACLLDHECSGLFRWGEVNKSPAAQELHHLYYAVERKSKKTASAPMQTASRIAATRAPRFGLIAPAVSAR